MTKEEVLTELIGIAQRILRLRKLRDRTGAVGAIHREEMIFMKKAFEYAHIITTEELMESPTIAYMISTTKLSEEKQDENRA